MFLAAAVALLVLAGSLPLSSRARAQTFFGAQRFPAIEVDTADNLYLMMSVATAPASVTVLAGQGSATFNVTTKAVSSNTLAVFGATANGVTIHIGFTVVP